MSDFPPSNPQTSPSSEQNTAPTETYTWRYAAKDLTDEMIFGVVFLAITLIFWIMGGGTWLSLFGILTGILGVVSLLYWLWIANMFFVRRLCTSYELNPQNFIYKHGFIVQHTRFIELFDIEQVNIKRNLWERIIGVGTVQLRIKDQNENNGKSIETLNIPGMTNFEEMQRLINEYRMYYRTKVGTPLVKA
ncbi:MAG: PH domain-containing protein [Planctomycetia bacterium]|nr:PH domain-containing protein [Planctomycetia bacterium]